MCFRPTAASKVSTCPGCQKKLTLQQGNMATKCPFCGTPLAEEEGKQTPAPKND